jgi:hypothetical protein
MRFRTLVLIPLAIVAAFLATGLVAGAPVLPSVLATEGEIAKALALAGCFVAALAFESGDYLRRAWLYSGLCYLLLLLRDAATLATSVPPAGGALVGLAVMATVANAASVAGTWMLAHAWRLAGIEEDAEARTRGRLLFAGGAVLALAITGFPLLRDAAALVRGDLGATVDVASDIGDTICLGLVAPVLQTALAMRGGVLRWPWGLLTASGLAWIVYDAVSYGARLPHWLLVAEGIRGLACALVLSAGLAQRLAVAPDVRLSLPGPG